MSWSRENLSWSRKKWSRKSWSCESWFRESWSQETKSIHFEINNTLRCGSSYIWWSHKSVKYLNTFPTLLWDRRVLGGGTLFIRTLLCRGQNSAWWGVHYSFPSIDGDRRVAYTIHSLLEKGQNNVGIQSLCRGTGLLNNVFTVP